MDQPDTRNEFRDLLDDITEQVSYLHELGVENLAVNFPESAFEGLESLTPPEPEPVGASPGLTEQFVPAGDILKNYPRPGEQNTETSPKESRRGLLEQTRLSNLPETSKRGNYGFKSPSGQTETELQQMTRENTSEKDPPVLIDIAQQLPAADETVENIRIDIGNCTRCPLHAERTNIVHSKGSFDADLMFVGEAPGADEDAQAAPFVGRAGQLLTKIIEGIGLKREDVFIGNINRCRPPGNRKPTAEESAVCKPFLLREIAVVRPKVIVVMGNTATQNLLETKVGISKLRGNFHEYYGVKVMPTFHPAYLLRDPRKKREVWDDMKKVRDEINKLG